LKKLLKKKQADLRQYLEDRNKKDEASKKAAQEAKQYWDNM